MSQVGVVHLVRKGNELEALRRFVASYDRHPSGVEHGLIALFKGFEPEDPELEEARSVLGGRCAGEVQVADDGYDIDAYFAAAESLDYAMLCFLNSFSEILDSHWLEKLYKNLERPDVGLVGATGSHQSIWYANVLREMQRRPRGAGLLGNGGDPRDRRRRRVLGARLGKIRGFGRFPNPHVRTNAFMIRRETLLQIEYSPIREKVQAYRFESGLRSMTRQVADMGLETLVVGRDGFGYEPPRWEQSDTFCTGEMSNLLVADNQTRDYASSEPERRRWLREHTWRSPWSFGDFGSDDPTRKCPHCVQPAEAFCETLDLNREIGDETFHYYQCRRCRYIYLHPVPEDLDRYYAGGYYGFPDDIDEWLPALEQQEGYKVRLIEKYARGRRLLEVGPSIGGALYLAKRAGYDVTAVEMDPECCAFMQDRLGIRAIQSADAARVLNDDTQTYDVITAWHVIEHLEDHRALIDAAVERLAPNGILILAAPNPDSLQFRLFGKNWAHLDAPRHVALIPPVLLKFQLTVLGLIPELTTTRDPGGRFWNLFGWEHTLGILLRHRRRKPGRRRGLEKVLTRVCHVLAWPIEVFLERGTAYTFVYRKES